MRRCEASRRDVTASGVASESGRRFTITPAVALALVLASASLLPLIVCHGSLQVLFYYGDDWDHLDQIRNLGVIPWAIRPFAENFVPFWKLLWGGLVLASDGSHFALVIAVWLTHALTVFLFALLLLRTGFSWSATAFATIIFGLAVSNIETLAWTTQWTTVFATAFLLTGLLAIDRLERDTVERPVCLALLLLVFSALSAFSMIRGVISGPVTAAMLLWPFFARRSWNWTKLVPALCAVLPAAITVLIIFSYSRGNHRAISGHLFEMLQFGWYCFALNPLHRLLDVDTVGWRTAFVLGSLKTGIIAWCLCYARSRIRRLLAVLLLFNIAESALLGIGRFHTGDPASVSSRYQYLALITFSPYIGFVFHRALQWLGSTARMPERALKPVAILLVLAPAFLVSYRWPEQLETWCRHRGTHTRQVIARDSPAGEVGAIPGIPYLTTDKARELTEEFSLH